eukprot:1743370-Amphidinium_carterae.1
MACLSHVNVHVHAGAEVHILDVSEDAITVVVTNLSFTDEEIWILWSISGIVSWTAPTAASTLVTGYSVFLTNAASNPTEWTQVLRGNPIQEMV